MKSLSPDYSRRSTLKFMSAVPLFPWIASCSGRSDKDAIPSEPPKGLLIAGNRPLKSLTFRSMDAPSFLDLAAMATTTVESSLVASYQDGTEDVYPLAYQPFFITGDRVPDGKGSEILAGGYYDIQNNPIKDLTHPDQRQFFSDAPDGSSLIQLPKAEVPGIKGNAVFAVVQFEYTSRDVAGAPRYAELPSPIAVLTLDQDPKSGNLSLVKYHNVDTSSVNGLWITCGSSLSPWNTHLSSEEYEPDATVIESNLQFKAFSKNLFHDETKANPYHYGHLPEVTVLPDGSGTIKKHYCLGRISHELVQVMPDERTVIMGDDATNGGAFLFIADRARDLSKGTLYAAKWIQKTAEKGGSADLKWIRLGHASSDEILALANRLKASDIVDSRLTDPLDDSFVKIRFAGTDNWVKFADGQDLAAAYLETHRYAAYKGASLGFTKWEGTTVNAADRVAYVAMASIVTSMVDGTTDIKVQGAKSGAIYALNLRGGQRDSDNNPIDSDWIPVDMAAIPELVGLDLSAADALGNLADPERIANPDNIKYSETLRTLFIGEDSGMHVNNFLWAYQVDSKKLVRILSCPAGAESTGLHAADSVNGYTYIVSNFQHPGDWDIVRDLNGTIKGGLHAQVYEKLDPLIRANYKDRFGAAVGYLRAVLPSQG